MGVIENERTELGREDISPLSLVGVLVPNDLLLASLRCLESIVALLELDVVKPRPAIGLLIEFTDDLLDPRLEDLLDETDGRFALGVLTLGATGFFPLPLIDAARGLEMYVPGG